jgi:uncharacterized membrane protein
MSFWTPQIHFIATAIHIFSAVFWLGWMVFIFFVMRPVVSRMPSIDVQSFMIPIRRRVRKFVFWLIPIILLTGLYNMGYRGLLDWQTLTGTAVGQRMLWKLGAAAVIFGIYYFAPHVMGGHSCSSESAGGHKPNSKGKKVELMMHVVAFTAGVTAAYLGVTIGG